MAALAPKVLVVDDDIAFGQLAGSVLDASGLPWAFVRTGEEALRWLATNPALGLIVDGLLPGMRGDELAAQLRETHPAATLPILFVSAFFRDLKSQQRLLKQIKVDAVLYKPLTREDLKRAFAQVPAFVQASTELTSALELDLPTSVELLAHYLTVGSDRLAQMREALRGLGGNDKATALATLRLEAHRFRGTGTSFGLAEITRLGATIEDLVESQPATSISEQTRAELAGLVDALGAHLRRAGAVPLGDPLGSAELPSEPRVLVVDGPGELALSCGEALAQGRPVRLYASVDEAVVAATESPPDVAFVSIDRPQFDGLEACRKLSGLGPVVAMSDDDSLSARLDAERAGAVGYIYRLPDAEALFQTAPRFAADRAKRVALAVADERALLGRLGETLSDEGISVVPCPNPRELFDLLELHAPALVVLSAQIPGFNAAACLGALRADPRYASVPVLVLGSTDEAEFALADALQALPVTRSTATVARRLVERRARALRTFEGDGLLGFEGLRELKHELKRALSHARRGRPMALMLFEAELQAWEKHKGRLASSAAVASLGTRLRQAFRAGDRVASTGYGQFGVLLFDIERAQAERLLEEHLRRLNSTDAASPGLPVHIKGAMASYPEVTGGARALWNAAVEALQARP